MLDSTPPLLRAYRTSERLNISAPQLVDRILGDEGIAAQLMPRWQAYQAHAQWRGARSGEEPRFTGDDGSVHPGSEAMSPSRTVNRLLGELVELTTSPYPEGVVRNFFKLAQANPACKARMAELPLLCCMAEGEMEKHYAQAALHQLEAAERTSARDGNPLAERAHQRLDNYCDRPEFRREKFASVTEKNHRIGQARRIFLLDEALKPFPYTHNYEHIAYGERRLLTDPRGHGNYPDSLLKHNQDRLLAGKAGAEREAAVARNPKDFGIPDLTQKHMTFVGSGALPLTGFMNHILTGCKVNLVDIDEDAVALSRKLVTRLEALGVLEKDAVKVYAAPASGVHYGGADAGGGYGHKAGETMPDGKIHVPTDVIYIAGLIPNEAKAALMADLETNKSEPVRTMMVRSARGLSRLLYEPVNNAAFEENTRYHASGSLIPERHVLPYRRRANAWAEDGADPVSVTAVLSDDNVNTALLLHRSELPLVNQDVMFEKGSKFAGEVERELGHAADYSHIDQQRARRMTGWRPAL